MQFVNAGSEYRYLALPPLKQLNSGVASFVFNTV